MDTPLRGAALPKAVPRMFVVAGLALVAGCAGYDRKPLSGDDFGRVLEQRTPGAVGMAEAVRSADYAPADGLSPAEAELLALYLNPRLRAAREAAKVPAAAARYAGLWDDPEIGADALRILDDVDEPWIAGASLSFTIPISGRLAVAKKRAEAEALAALVEAWAEEQAVLRDLRVAWAEWEAAARSASVSRDLHERLRELVSLTDRREELGEMIAAEAVAFRLAEARLRLDVGELEADEAQARLRVLELLGLLPGSEAVLVPADDAKAEDPPSHGTVWKNSPAVLLAAARYEAAEERLRLEVRKQYPDITLGPLYGNEEGMDRLGVGVSVPVPILNANRQGIAEADAARNAARAEWERTVQESISALARTEAAIAAGERRLVTMRSTVVPLANRQIEHARRLAELGEIDTLLILEAIQSEREAALDLIEAETAVARVRAELRALLPEEVPAFELDKTEETR